MNRLDARQGEQAVVIVAGYHESVKKFLRYNDGMDRLIGFENRFVLRDLNELAQWMVDNHTRAPKSLQVVTDTFGAT